MFLSIMKITDQRFCVFECLFIALEDHTTPAPSRAILKRPICQDCVPVAPTSTGLDVHTHASRVQAQVLACLPQSRPTGSVKLKKTMSDTTWALVGDKRKWRQTLREAAALQRATLLQAYLCCMETTT